MDKSKKLALHAPWSDSQSTAGGFVHRPWTKEAMAQYEEVGGWFKRTPLGQLDGRYFTTADLKGRPIPRLGHDRCTCAVKFRESAE